MITLKCTTLSSLKQFQTARDICVRTLYLLHVSELFEFEELERMLNLSLLTKWSSVSDIHHLFVYLQRNSIQTGANLHVPLLAGGVATEIYAKGSNHSQSNSSPTTPPPPMSYIQSISVLPPA